MDNGNESLAGKGFNVGKVRVHEIPNILYRQRYGQAKKHTYSQIYV